MSNTMLAGLIAEFLKQYDASNKDSIWKQQSIRLADYVGFWVDKKTQSRSSGIGQAEE